MSANSIAEEKRDHSLLHFEFRRAISWGWSILGGLSIISALVSQSSIKSWQIYYSIAVLGAMLLAYLLDYFFQSALVYAPILLVIWFAPFFLNDQSQQAWFSIGLISVATLVSVSNIENTKISISLSLLAIFFQQYMATQDLPSVTDSNDLLLLHGYFGVSWCLLITFGLLYIRRGYIRYHDNIDEQLNQVYENQLSRSKSALAINTKDYRNLQLHGTVLNTLIYARDNLDLSKSEERINLASLIAKDVAILRGETTPEDSLENRIRKTVNDIDNRKIDIWLEPIKDFDIEENIKLQILEILREKILNLKKHSKAQNCEISVRVETLKVSGFAFMRPTQYRLIIEVKDDALLFEKPNLELHKSQVLASKSLNRILQPILARQRISIENARTIHFIEIPLVNFQPNAAQKLFDLRSKSQEFIAKSYVLISMLYGAICLPALLRVNVPTEIFLVCSIVVIGSLISVFTPRFNTTITLINALLSLFPLLLSVQGNAICQDLDYLPWIFNGLIGPIFFAVLTIRIRYYRWIPAILFFIESIIVTNLLPDSCQSLLSGSTPAIIVLSFLAVVILRIRRRSYKKDQILINQFQSDSYSFAETRLRLDLERDEIVESLAKYAASIPLSARDSKDLLTQLNLYILEIRALLVSAEYFDNKLVQAVYYLVKNRLRQDRFSEIHIITDNFAEFESENSYAELEKALRFQSKNEPLRISILTTDKTEVRYTEIEKSNTLPKVLFEDTNIRLVRN
jgi:signal transduction histidine kinase